LHHSELFHAFQSMLETILLALKLMSSQFVLILKKFIFAKSFKQGISHTFYHTQTGFTVRTYGLVHYYPNALVCDELEPSVIELLEIT